jgi:hypothetical protein
MGKNYPTISFPVGSWVRFLVIIVFGLIAWESLSFCWYLFDELGPGLDNIGDNSAYEKHDLFIIPWIGFQFIPLTLVPISVYAWYKKGWTNLYDGFTGLNPLKVLNAECPGAVGITCTIFWLNCLIALACVTSPSNASKLSCIYIPAGLTYVCVLVCWIFGFLLEFDLIWNRPEQKVDKAEGSGAEYGDGDKSGGGLDNLDS